MLANKIIPVEQDEFSLPVIIRSNQEGWIPTFDLWSTKIKDEASYIDCSQIFRKNIKGYDPSPINPMIGHYSETGDLVIYWKALIDRASINEVNAAYHGKLRATSWQKRYCTYFSLGSSTPWLHSVVLDFVEADFVVHHINGVSADNRIKNLHILPKREHDGINHPGLEIRKAMFTNPDDYWQERKNLALNDFIKELSLIIIDESKSEFIAKFAKENKALALEILRQTKLDINLSQVRECKSANRLRNLHLPVSYLDTYEIEKYLRTEIIKKSSEGQLRLF